MNPKQNPKAELRKAYNDALPFVTLILGLLLGIMGSELMTMIHEMAREQGEKYFQQRPYLIVFLALFLLWIVYSTYKEFIRPLNKLKKEVDQHNK